MDRFEELVNEIKSRVFDGRGFVKANAEEVAEVLKDFGVKTGSVSRYYCEFLSGNVVYHERLGEIRIYGGNTCKISRWSRKPVYIYPYIAIPLDLSDEDIKKALEVLKRGVENEGLD